MIVHSGGGGGGGRRRLGRGEGGWVGVVWGWWEQTCPPPMKRLISEE